MVSARDEVVNAIMTTLRNAIYDYELASALDAVPSDLLVRLAVERGALKDATIGIGSPAGDLFVIETGETYHEYETELYIATGGE